MQIEPVSTQPTPPHRVQRAGLVLLVDDEPLLGEMMQQGLSRKGIDSMVTVSAAEALELARRYPIALLVTDLMMPGMTGIELAGKVRHLQSSVPVILVSGTPDAAALVIEPPSAFLAKPFSLRDLAAAAASLLATSRLTG